MLATQQKPAQRVQHRMISTGNYHLPKGSPSGLDRLMGDHQRARPIPSRTALGQGGEHAVAGGGRPAAISPSNRSPPRPLAASRLTRLASPPHLPVLRPQRQAPTAPRSILREHAPPPHAQRKRERSPSSSQSAPGGPTNAPAMGGREVRRLYGSAGGLRRPCTSRRRQPRCCFPGLEGGSPGRTVRRTRGGEAWTTRSPRGMEAPGGKGRECRVPEDTAQAQCCSPAAGRCGTLCPIVVFPSS